MRQARAPSGALTTFRSLKQIDNLTDKAFDKAVGFKATAALRQIYGPPAR